jgi:hypothetical protein
MTMTTTQTGSNVSVSEKALPVINYAPFRSAARRFTNEKITRERLVFDWREAQQEQGIRAAQLKRN